MNKDFIHKVIKLGLITLAIIAALALGLTIFGVSIGGTVICQA